MGLETLIMAIVAGTITISILSILFQPGGPTTGIISAIIDGYSGVLGAAKKVPA